MTLRCIELKALCLLLLLILEQQAYSQSKRDLKLEAAAPNPMQALDRRTRWALVVGISRYQHLPPQFQLRFAHRDADEFARFLRSPEGGGMSADHLKLLLNADANISNIRAALHTWLPKSVGPDDVVYIFFAGHGVVAEDNEGYFVAHDSDPQNLHATRLAFREVDSTLSQRWRAGRIVLMAVG